MSKGEYAEECQLIKPLALCTLDSNYSESSRREPVLAVGQSDVVLYGVSFPSRRFCLD